MAIRFAVNGFGRIGRAILRSWIESQREDIVPVAVNDSSPPASAAHFLRYDSVHGRYPLPVKVNGNLIDIGRGEPLFFTSDRNPANLDWGALNVDIVAECTGSFTSKDKALIHLSSGAKKVLVSAPADNADLTVVYGVNHHLINADQQILSNASCTTNCLAPVAKILHETVGIANGFMLTVHSYTNDQNILDQNHRDLYRARAAAINMIPTSTGAAKAVSLVLPELAGKLDGAAVRVPTANVSLIDFSFNALRDTSVEEINNAFIKASEGALRGILKVTNEPLVSSDFCHDPASATVALEQTKVANKNFVRVAAWYDNEWGFANRMCDTIAAMGKFL